GLGYTCMMTPKTTSNLDNGHLTAAQIIQHHEAIWAGLFLTFLPSIN
ncbi:cysteine hydrolase, partial [Enterococcus faecalis]